METQNKTALATHNIFTSFQFKLIAEIEALQTQGKLPADLPIERSQFELPREESHGDLATNAAMVLSKPAGFKKPRDLAELLAAQMEKWDGVDAVEIAGPGFLNLRLSLSFWQKFLNEILTAGEAYGHSTMGAGQTVNVEYVSTNPTGPLHIGHVRGAVIGDVLASMYAATGHKVIREYYVNDAGTQVDVLARSAYLRYCEALGKVVSIPEGLYPGDYLIPFGQALAKEHGDVWLDKPESEWLDIIRPKAIEAMLDLIRRDLARMGIEQIYSSERALVENGAVAGLIDRLKDEGKVYTGQLPPPKGKVDEDWEPRDQLLMKTTDFGDKEDRALMKSDGTYTYFATDVAYHIDKFTRQGDTSADQLVDVWGADHHGHVGRMKAALKCAGHDGAFDVILCNMVNLMRDGVEVKMSKRAGTLVPLADLLDEVGADVVRFMILTRKSTENLAFDLKKAVEKSLDSPLFYVQFAHARIHSVERKVKTLFDVDQLLSESNSDRVALDSLSRPEEISAIRKLAAWPRMLETATKAQEPHRIVFYLMDVASSFHSLWSAGHSDATLRFIIENDLAVTRARLALLVAIRQVIRSGFGILGVEPVEEM